LLHDVLHSRSMPQSLQGRSVHPCVGQSPLAATECGQSPNAGACAWRRTSRRRSSTRPSTSARHAAYAASQRKRIEEAFGWAKTIASLAKLKVGGLARVRHCFTWRW